MADLSQYLNKGGNQNGFPSTPNGNAVDHASSTRHFPIYGTTDSIRIPATKTGATTLGYRRVDSQGSGGGSEWLISFSTLAAFSGLNVTALANGRWGGCVIKNGKIYIGFWDGGSATASPLTSWVIRADLTTGAIEAFMNIPSTGISVATSAQIDGIMFDIGRTFWDVTDSGVFIFVIPDSSSALANKGVSQIVFSSSMVLADQAQLLRNANGLTADVETITYRTQDGSLYIGLTPTGSGSSRSIYMGNPTNGVVTINPADIGASLYLTELAQSGNTTINATTATFSVPNEGSLMIHRMITETTSANSVSRPFVSKNNIDNYLKSVYEAYSGVKL